MDAAGCPQAGPLLTGSVRVDVARPDFNSANLLPARRSRVCSKFFSPSGARAWPRPRWRLDKVGGVDTGTGTAPHGRPPEGTGDRAAAPPVGGFISELNTRPPRNPIHFPNQLSSPL